MTDDPSLLAASAMTYVGVQVILLGLLMLSVGIIIGVNIVAQPAAVEYYSPVLGYAQLPYWLERAATVSKGAAVSAVLSLGGLIWMDYTRD
jgi:hypothetical protein